MSKSEKNEYIENPNKDYKLIINSESNDNDDEETILVTAESIQKQSESWMYDALQSFEKVDNNILYVSMKVLHL